MQKSDHGQRPVTQELDSAPEPAPVNAAEDNLLHQNNNEPHSQQGEKENHEAGLDMSAIDFEADGIFWTVGTTEDGYNYYYDVATGLSQWEDPREAGNLTHIQHEHEEGQDQGMTEQQKGGGGERGHC